MQIILPTRGAVYEYSKNMEFVAVSISARWFFYIIYCSCRSVPGQNMGTYSIPFMGICIVLYY